jgi:hypothetical protein
MFLPTLAYHHSGATMDQPTTAAAEQVKPMSFSDKLVSIFASPGELFENVRTTGPTTSNWLVPWVILVIVSIVLSFIMLNNPSLADQMGATMRQAIDKNVAAGKMTQEQADQAFNMTRPGTVYFTVLSIGGTIIWTLGSLFALGLIYWLIGKTAMSATAPYMKVVEVIGLTFFISTLEVIVTTLMLIAFDRITATPSLGFFISDFDVTNKVHLLLSKVNIFTFWILAVTSVGLSKVFQRDLAKVAVLVVVLWILWTVVTVFAGCGFGR